MLLTTIGEAFEINPQVRIPKGTEVPFVTMDQVVPGQRNVSAAENRVFKGGSKFEHGDTLMARITPCLENKKIAQYLPPNHASPSAGSTEFIVIRGKNDVSITPFAYYFVQSPDIHELAISLMTGTSGRQRVDTEAFRMSEIWLPNLTTQEKIVKVLGSLDDKIAVNNKIIELALKLAKLLPQCVQQEQQKYKLSEISNLISRGITPKYVEDGFTVLNQKCIRNNLVDLNQARQASNLPKNHERILQQYDVLVNSTGYGTLGRISPWLHETAQLKTVITDTHITTIRFDDQKVDPAFAAIVLSTQENAVANLAEGSTGQTELKRELIENFEIMLPPFAIQHEVSQQIRPLLLAVMTLRDENQTLARTRDELLPLLMSGKITVRDAEEAAAEVGVDKHEVEE